MLPLRPYAHLNDAKLPFSGIFALFFWQLVSCALCTTALGLFKRLGKFSVVMRTGHATHCMQQGTAVPSARRACASIVFPRDRRVYGSILAKDAMMKDDLSMPHIIRALVYFPEPVRHAEKG